MKDHALDLVLEKATPVDPILTQLVQEGFLPEIVFDVIEEFLLLMGGQVIWHDSRGQVVSNIGKSRRLSRRGVMVLNNEPRDMISHDILSSRLVLDLHVKLLKRQNSPDEATLSILLLKEVLECRMVGVHDDLRT